MDDSPFFDIQGLDKCKKHGDEQLKFLCKDHDELSCNSCFIIHHRNCNEMVEVERISNTRLSDLDNLRRELFDIDNNANAYDQSLKNIQEKVSADGTKIIGNIKEMQDKVNDMFEHLKQYIGEKTNSFQNKVLHDIGRKRKVCIKYIKDVNDTLSYVKIVRQRGTPAQRLIMAYQLKHHVKTLKETIHQGISEFENVHMSFEFDRSVDLPPAKYTRPGKLTMEYVSSGVIVSGYTEKSQQKDQKLKLTLLDSVDMTHCYDKNKIVYTGLAFLPDGRLIAVDNLNKKFIVYNQKLQIVGSMLLWNIPYDVTVVTDDEVAVSCGPQIYFIKIGKSSQATITSTLKVTTKCESICMIKNDMFLVECNDNRQPFGIVTAEGDETELAITFPWNQYPVGKSACTFISNCNKAVLTDQLANTVYIYEKTNETRVEVKDETIIQEPHGVPAGPADCIFVCSRLTHSIVQISHTGLILSPKLLDVRCPYTVCVSNDKTLLAVFCCDSNDRKLHLYKIEIV